MVLSLPDARCIIEGWRQDYNTARPHSALGYLTPAEFEEPSPNGEWGTQPAEEEEGGACLVVVGSIGSDLRMDYTAVGDTTTSPRASSRRPTGGGSWSPRPPIA